MPEEPSKPRKSRDLKPGHVLENRYEILERVSSRLPTRKTATTHHLGFGVWYSRLIDL